MLKTKHQNLNLKSNKTIRDRCIKQRLYHLPGNLTDVIQFITNPNRFVSQAVKTPLPQLKFKIKYVSDYCFIVSVFFAAVIPNLELFISLVGAFALSTMGLSFPAMIQMLTFWDYYQGPGKILFFLKNFTVIIIAALGRSNNGSCGMIKLRISYSF